MTSKFKVIVLRGLKSGNWTNLEDLKEKDELIALYRYKHRAYYGNFIYNTKYFTKEFKGVVSVYQFDDIIVEIPKNKNLKFDLNFFTFYYE